VNVAATWLVARADRTSLNVEGAFQHILNDLFAFIATAIAGLIVLITGWGRADAIAALVVAALMARAGWGLIRDSWRIFLEAAPRGTDVAAIDRAPHAVDGGLEIHDLHVWEVTSGFPALSAPCADRPLSQLPRTPPDHHHAPARPLRARPHHPAGRPSMPYPRAGRRTAAVHPAQASRPASRALDPSQACLPIQVRLHYDAVLAGTHNASHVDRWPLVAALCREPREAA